MVKRLARGFLAVAALILCLPAVRFVERRLTPAPVVDRNSPAWKAREALIARAKVFVEPRPVIRRLDLSEPPTKLAHFDRDSLIECRYVPRPTTGTTPKFDCRLPDGALIKVKYGDTRERLAEVAATRLLAALGFGADEVTLMPELRCLGCPPQPFEWGKFADWFFASWLLDRAISDNARQDFHWVSVERKLPGRAIELENFEGWDWNELDRVDAAAGGATRAELDALRLIAVFLGHWDNKARNQRLLCEEGPGGDDPTAPCARPLLMLHDVGATFGAAKVEQHSWAATPIWADAAACIVKQPHMDGTFDSIRISEAGRVLLASRVRQLSKTQVFTIFESAGFPDPATGEERGNVTTWVNAFLDKVRQIDDRPACPGA